MADSTHINLHFTGNASESRLGIHKYSLNTEDRRTVGVELPWNELRERLVALQKPDNAQAIARIVGKDLRKFLSSEYWAQQELRLTGKVSRQERAVLTISAEDPDLYALPWELLTLEPSDQQLGRQSSVLVRYEWPDSKKRRPEERSLSPKTGRILFAWSASGGDVGHDEHLSAIKQAAAKSHDSDFFKDQPDVVSHASAEKLKKCLEDARDKGEPISVLHLLCHGSSQDVEGKEVYGLLLDGNYPGEQKFLGAAALRNLLEDHAGMVRLVVLSACNSSDMGELGEYLGSVALELHKAGIACVIASRFPLSISGSIQFSEVFYDELLGRPSSVEDAFLSARKKLAQETSGLDWASLQLYARSADGDDTRPINLRPYRGLESFEDKHSRFFFGRDKEIKEIIGDLKALIDKKEPRLLVVAGASGTGKSSVVLAGAVPRMREDKEANWVVASMRPGNEPMKHLENALAQRTDRTRPLLLVVDQFEEIFTQTNCPEKRNEFAMRLWKEASDASSGVSIIITLRIDFLGHCGGLSLNEEGLRLDKIAFDEAHKLYVRQMESEQMKEAILGPARLVGLKLADGLAEEIVKDVATEPGALPLVEFTLDELWKKRESGILTRKAYKEMGYVTGSLTKMADALVDGLDPEGQKIARRLLVRLVSTSPDAATDTRRRETLEALRPPSPENRGCGVIRKLGILASRVGTGLANWCRETLEALKLPSPENRGWGKLSILASRIGTGLANLRRPNTATTSLTALERFETTLSKFVEARLLVRSSGYDIGQNPPTPHDKAATSEQAAPSKRSEDKSGPKSQADGKDATPAKEMVEVAHEALIRKWTRLKEWVDADRPKLKDLDMVKDLVARHYNEKGWKLSGKYLLLAERVEKDFDGALSGDLRKRLQEGRKARRIERLKQLNWKLVNSCTAIFSILIIAIVVLEKPSEPPQGSVKFAAVSPDGTHIVTVFKDTDDTTVRVLQTDGTSVAELRGHQGVKSAAVSSDGTHIVTIYEDKTARVWKADGTPVETLNDHNGHQKPVKSAAFNQDGTLIVTASTDTTLQVWKTNGDPNGYLVATLNGHPRHVKSAAFNQDGDIIVTDSADTTVRVWKKQGNMLKWK